MLQVLWLQAIDHSSRLVSWGSHILRAGGGTPTAAPNLFPFLFSLLFPPASSAAPRPPTQGPRAKAVEVTTAGAPQETPLGHRVRHMQTHPLCQTRPLATGTEMPPGRGKNIAPLNDSAVKRPARRHTRVHIGEHAGSQNRTREICEQSGCS